jgi:hypothetical protein
MWKHKRPKIAKAILDKKAKLEVSQNRASKLYCRTTVTKPAWNWHKNRHVCQWNKDPEINPHRQPYGSQQRCQKYTLEKRASSTNGARKTIFTCRRLKLDPCLSPCTQSGSKD